jgi:SAM-dependent methyltransferase
MIMETLQPRLCPVCQSRDRSSTYAQANIALDRLDAFAFASRKLPEYMHWRLAECGGCDLLYADPIPTPEALAHLYRDADFDSGREAGLAGQTYASFLPRIASRLPDRAGAVDVGTGDGAFLRHLLAAGFTGVAGVEPSEAPVAAADPDIRPLIRLDVFRDDLFPAESLALVTCFQTIEHLTDPLAFCRAAYAVLKPGGALLLIGHDRRAMTNRLLGKRSPIYDIEHMQLFSPRSFRALLEAAGFIGTELLPVRNRYPIRYWARLFPFPGRIKQPILRVLQSTCLGAPVVGLPTGNLAVLGFKPA